MKRNRIGMKITVCAFACALLTLTACKSTQTAQQEATAQATEAASAEDKANDEPKPENVTPPETPKEQPKEQPGGQTPEELQEGEGAMQEGQPAGRPGGALPPQEPGEATGGLPDAAIGPTGDVRVLVTVKEGVSIDDALATISAEVLNGAAPEVNRRDDATGEVSITVTQEQIDALSNCSAVASVRVQLQTPMH